MMKRRPGRRGRRAAPRGNHRAAPVWMPLQPPAEDVRLLGTPHPAAEFGSHQDQPYGPLGGSDHRVSDTSNLNWVQFSYKGFSVN